MTDDESIAMNQGRIFQCLNCKEYINDAMSVCRFCGYAIDSAAAQAAADARDRINRACNDGNYLQIMARTTVIVYFLSWIPLIGMAGSYGFFFLMIGVPVMTVRWWVKYGNIQTDDSDYQRARGRVVISAAIWGGMVIVWLIGSIVYAALFSTMSLE